MRKIVLLVLLLQTVFASAGKPKPIPADYKVKVQVIRSWNWDGYQAVEAMVDGKDVYLKGAARGVLLLGDYMAKVVRPQIKPAFPTSHDYVRGYEFLFADGTTRYYEVAGIAKGVYLPPIPPEEQ